MGKENIIENIIKEVSEKRAEIIDDFLKMFVASRLEWFKEKSERLRRIQLIETRHNDFLNNKIITTWSIKMMSGKNRQLKDEKRKI